MSAVFPFKRRVAWSTLLLEPGNPKIRLLRERAELLKLKEVEDALRSDLRAKAAIRVARARLSFQIAVAAP